MRVAIPDVLNPSLQFRYEVFSSRIPGAFFYARSATQPAFTNNPIKVHYDNGYFHVKGKTTWEDITIECYQYEGITTNEILKYFKRHHVVEFALDQELDLYKHDLQLSILNPMDIPIGTWSLVGSFFKSVSFGEMNWGTDDPIQATLTICYDYAEYRNFI